MKSTTVPYPRIPYRECLLKYGTDKPDLRIPLEIQDFSGLFMESGFNAFSSIVKKGGVVRAISVKGIADRPRSFFDRMLTFAQSIGSQGLAYIVFSENEQKGPIVKFLKDSELDILKTECGIAPGDVIFFICNKKHEAERIAGEIRVKLADELELREKDVFRFCWIVDFPMYQFNEDKKCIEFSHNPFSMPQGGMKALDTKDPLEILAHQYDIVCNGVELSSGAIRNHSPEIMYKAFKIGGYTKEEVDNNFGALIHAFKHGAPPHGGIAPGIDRLVMLLAHESNIREVIAFPMNQRAQDLMMDAPREVSEKQLRELYIKVSKPVKIT